MSVAHPTPQPGTEEYHPVFAGKTLEQLGEILTRYPTKQAALLPALWLVQEARGWISDRNMAEVAEVLGLTPAYVKGVVTFYTMYHQHPVGKHFVQVCTTGRREGVARRDRRQGARRYQPRRQVDGDRGGVPGGLWIRDSGARGRRLPRERVAREGSGDREKIQVKDKCGMRNAECGIDRAPVELEGRHRGPDLALPFRIPHSAFGGDGEGGR